MTRLLELVLQGSFITLIVLLILVAMSIYSWGIIFYKFFHFQSTKKKSKHFIAATKSHSIEEKITWSKLNKQSLNAKVVSFAAFEYSSLKNLMPSERIAVIEKSASAHISKILQNYEDSLSSLATISVTAPFIGLFGTVVGITIAFHDIAKEGASSLAVVAPGISEALVATGAGLFAAIPASFFYNYFRSEVRIFSNSMKQTLIDTVTQILKKV